MRARNRARNRIEGGSIEASVAGPVNLETKAIAGAIVVVLLILLGFATPAIALKVSTTLKVGTLELGSY